MIQSLPVYVIMSFIAGIVMGIAINSFSIGLMVWLGSFYVLIIAHIIMKKKQKESEL